MRSSGSPEPLTLDHDLPTTPHDVAVLKRLRCADTITTPEYLRFLRVFDPLPHHVLRSRPGPGGPEFALLAG